MFGSNDQNQNYSSSAAGLNDQATPSANPLNTDSAMGDAVGPTSAPLISMPAQNTSAEPDVLSSAPSAPTIPDPMVTPSAQPESGINGVPLQNAYVEPAPQAGATKSSEPENVPSTDSITNASASQAVIDPDLAQIKQQALQSLEPLVSQLDQAPEEKFKTIMMLVQASDNSKMLGSAYEAASQISDEKIRAQALLDIVNEVNYFNQQKS